MNKEKQEKLQEKKHQEDYNWITLSNKVENQNQTHNSRKEGVTPKNNKR